MLDVSDAILDQDLGCEFITVTRRPVVMVKGRATVPAPVVTENVPAVVNTGVTELMRAADLSVVPKRISIHTPFRLFPQVQSPDGTVQYLPDIVTWNNNKFIPLGVDDYSRYGAGFVHADCASMDKVDDPPGTANG